MTREDIDILLELRGVVEANLGRDPVCTALDRKVPHAALVATQVKYLQRAESKMPSFFRARCIVPPLSFEQASSEVTALNKRFEGGTAVDLTCGLGVDAWALSRRFGHVVAVERDPVLAYLARVNFGLLGVDNVTVVNAAAEDFAIPAEADLIYIDADRRGAHGKKLVLLQDCSPDVMELMPRLKGRRVVLKLSPMFDVDEARRILGGRVEVVSAGGECREVVVESTGRPGVAATVIGFGTVEDVPDSPAVAMPAMNCLVVPDPALVKARLARRYFGGKGLYIEHDTGFAIASDLPGELLPGRSYRIVKAEPYSPKTFKKHGIKRADIIVRNFPHPAPVVAKQLGIAGNGGEKIAVTRIGKELWTFFLDPASE